MGLGWQGFLKSTFWPMAGEEKAIDNEAIQLAKE